MGHSPPNQRSPRSRPATSYENKQRHRNTRGRRKAVQRVEAQLDDRKKVVEPELVRTGRELSLIDHPSHTTAFLRRLETRLKWKNMVSLDLSRLTYVTSDGIAAAISLGRLHKWQLGGYLPDDPKVQETLRSLGLLLSKKENGTWVLEGQKGRVVRSEQGQPTSVQLDAIAFLGDSFGVSRARHSATYRIVGECMANTANHAESSAHSSLPTFNFYNYYDSARDVVCFTFLDYGGGILQSLARRGVIDAAKRRFLPHVVLADAMEGKYGSRTGAAGRGRGLRSIRDACVLEGRIGRLVVVANGAYVDLLSSVRKGLQRPFPGTFIYWEVARDTLEDPPKRSPI